MWPSQGTPTRWPGASAVDAGPDRHHAADDLVTGHDRQLRVRQLAVDDVQVGAADAAGATSISTWPGPGWAAAAGLAQGQARPVQQHRAHRRHDGTPGSGPLIRRPQHRIKPRMTPALMIQGTCSNAGKSLLVAGLCRAFRRRGLAVLPFKPQNMSNNAAATADGGEIGRAQALQARACGVAATVDMNPVLLKPQSETGAQVVVQGRVLTTCAARDYHRLKPTLLPRVLDSFARLEGAADLVLVEGAGSPAEVNLRAGDIANMGFALAARVPVILAGDIERGGVIAQLVGTVALLEPEERALLRGYIVNKFRGDPGLFDSAHPLILERTGLQSLGVVTWFEAARNLPKEDVLGLEEVARSRPGAAIRVAVPRLPRIANFDDLEPLAAEPDVALRLLEPGEALPGDTDLVLLPGSKATIADLAAFRAAGWDIDLQAHVRRGGWVLGLCGGYQMLGTRIADPEGLGGSAPDGRRAGPARGGHRARRPEARRPDARHRACLGSAGDGLRDPSGPHDRAGSAAAHAGSGRRPAGRCRRRRGADHGLLPARPAGRGRLPERLSRPDPRAGAERRGLRGGRGSGPRRSGGASGALSRSRRPAGDQPTAMRAAVAAARRPQASQARPRPARIEAASASAVPSPIQASSTITPP